MREISHRTWSGFRVEYQQELDELFAQVLAALRGEGMITLERMVQDGTKVKAAASPASLHREATLPQHLEVARERVRQRGDPRQDQPDRAVNFRKSTFKYCGVKTSGRNSRRAPQCGTSTSYPSH